MLVFKPFTRHTLKVSLEFIHGYIHALYSRFQSCFYIAQAFVHVTHSLLRTRIEIITMILTTGRIPR